MRVTLATTFVLALVAFVSDTAPVLAGGEFHSCLENWTSSECIDINRVRDPDQFEIDREVDSDDAAPAAVKQSEDEPGGTQ